MLANPTNTGPVWITPWITPSLAVAYAENTITRPFTLSEEHLMPARKWIPEVNLTLPARKSGIFSAYQQPTEVKDNFKVLLVFKKLLEDCACTEINLSIANIPLEHYRTLIRQYTIEQLGKMHQILAQQIMSPELSQTQRQAESRCILSLIYLEQGREDKARAQLKQAEKTPGFALPKEFDDLYQQLKHPRKSLSIK